MRLHSQLKKTYLHYNLDQSEIFNDSVKSQRIFQHQYRHYHCVKSVRLRSFFWSVFSGIRTDTKISPYSVWTWENTDQKKLRIWTHFIQCILDMMLTPARRFSTETRKLSPTSYFFSNFIISICKSLFFSSRLVLDAKKVFKNCLRTV